MDVFHVDVDAYKKIRNMDFCDFVLEILEAARNPLHFYFILIYTHKNET